MVEAAQRDFSKEEKELERLRAQANLDKVNEELGEEPPESSAEESLPSEQDTQPEEPDEEPKEEDLGEQSKQETEDVVPPEKPLSKRGEKRFQELVDARKQAEERAQSLEREREQLLRSLQNPLSPQQPFEYTPEQYQNDLVQKAEEMVKQTIRKERQEDDLRRAHENFLEDLEKVTEKHPALNEKSPDYDPTFDSLVGEYYEAMIQKNPRIRLTEVVEQFTEVRNAGIEKAKKAQVDKVAKQASSQAITPGGEDPERENIIDRVRAVETEEDLEKIKREIGTT